MVPRLYRVRRRWRENHDTISLSLDPLQRPNTAHRPGQFNMLYCYGVGEVPISISSHPDPGRPLLHTIRAAGPVSTALCRAKQGETVGVRGPFGTGWDVEDAEGADLVLIAGGIGLAPLRSALRYALAKRRHYGRLVLLVGARSPEEMVFRRELNRLSSRPDVITAMTVDRAGPAWRHHVGMVTQLIPAAPFDPASALALVCGPEVMMRFTATALLGRGMPAERIRLSLERNMKCAIGWCGHCQLGSQFLCKDGPVRSWIEAAPLLAVKER
jgi:NAD(P)H-flavin reductase